MSIYTAKLGFWSALLTSVLTTVTFAIAFFTPPLSGPGCVSSCYQYPYLDIASRFPRDYIWMYPAMLMTLIYFILMVCVHRAAPKSKKIFTQIGMYFAFMATIVLLSDYFIQVSVVQPSLLKGEADGISLLTQFNSHGVFIALEDLGYILMSLGFMFIALNFSNNKLGRAIKWIFTANFMLTTLSFIVITLMYGIYREYRFEIVSLSVNWLTFIVSGILLAKYFKHLEAGSKTD